DQRRVPDGGLPPRLAQLLRGTRLRDRDQRDHDHRAPLEPHGSDADWTPPRTAVNGDLLVVDTAMYCHDAVVDGQFRLPGARIGDYLHLDGARITHEKPDRPPTPALLAQGLRVDTGMFARRGNTQAKNRFTVTGGVDISGATIKGGLT